MGKILPLDLPYELARVLCAYAQKKGYPNTPDMILILYLFSRLLCNVLLSIFIHSATLSVDEGG